MVETPDRRPLRGALAIVGMVTALLCVGIVAVFVDTPAPPPGLAAAVLLGIGIARLLLRRRDRDR